MKQTVELTPHHLAVIQARVSLIEDIIQMKSRLEDIVLTLNGRAHVVYCLKKEITDVCSFRLHEGALWYKVYQDRIDPHYAHYVEVLSATSIKLAH